MICFIPICPTSHNINFHIAACTIAYTETYDLNLNIEPNA